MVGWECPTNPREASGLDPEAVHRCEDPDRIREAYYELQDAAPMETERTLEEKIMHIKSELSDCKMEIE